MPEGHTIHRICRDHQAAFAGQRMIVASPQGRFEDEAKKLSGRTLLGTAAHGKHLFYQWAGKRGATANPTIMHVHLGLYGKFRLHKNPAPEPRGAVRVRMMGQSQSVDLNGPTRCKILSKTEYQTLINRLGADPLQSNVDPAATLSRIRKSKAAIGALLLNQSIIAGLGNIYRAEILFLLGIDPERPGSSLSTDQLNNIWQRSVDLLKIGVKYNRIITVDLATAGKPISKLKRDERLLVYKRERCVRCRTKISKWTLGSRTMYACRKCQT